MKSKEEIINDSMKKELSPKNYNLLETQCFLALKQLLIMYHNKLISKEKATMEKRHILAKYEQDVGQYEFERSMFSEHVQHIKDTEMARIKLHKILNQKEEITEEKLCETINVCMQIISTVFRGEF